MKNKITLICGLLVALICLTLVPVVQKRIWWRIADTEVSYGGAPSISSHVYTQSASRKVLLIPSGTYLIEPDLGTVSASSEPILLEFPWFALVLRPIEGGVSLKSAKIDHVHPILVSKEVVEFTDLEGQRVAVQFR